MGSTKHLCTDYTDYVGDMVDKVMHDSQWLRLHGNSLLGMHIEGSKLGFDYFDMAS